MTIRNLRSFSEIKINKEKHFKSGLYVRSAALHKLSDEDKKFLLDELNVTKVVDLRASSEISQKPDIKVSEINYVNIPLVENNTYELSDTSFENIEERLKQLNSIEEQIKIVPHMINLYRHILTGPIARTNLKNAVWEVINNPTGATLFHCVSGKDRTGIVTASIMMAAGATEDEIMEEFLKSRDSSLFEAEIIYNNYIKMGFAKEIAGLMKENVIIKPEYMDAFIYEVKKQYSDFNRFSIEFLGFTEESLKEYRLKVLS